MVKEMFETVREFSSVTNITMPNNVEMGIVKKKID
jgi:hypothetical protein